jgi:hypothetical protein
MTTLFETQTRRIDLSTIADAEGIQHRLMHSYPMFMQNMKSQAVRSLLGEEFSTSAFACNEDFIERAIACLSEEALVEKSLGFLTVSAGCE